jgi:hypothetical protein
MKTQRGAEKMIASTLLHRFCVCASFVAALGLAVFAGSASAAATTGTYDFQETGTQPDVWECTGLSGTTTTTVTVDGRYTDIGNGAQHVSETDTFDRRSDWSDGTYLISHSTVHAEFDTNGFGDAEFTLAQQDRGTDYSADGQVLGHRTVFTLVHFTWHDDFQTVISSPSEFRVSCT